MNSEKTAINESVRILMARHRTDETAIFNIKSLIVTLVHFRQTISATKPQKQNRSHCQFLHHVTSLF
jgi:hypothetical protein